jgi:hypothetical protein
VEFAERPHTGMNTLLAREQLTADADVSSPSRRTARAMAIVRSVSSVVSPKRYGCVRLVAHLGMIVPGRPSNPRTPRGYQWAMSCRDRFSVCLPMASPVDRPLSDARTRFTVTGGDHRIETPLKRGLNRRIRSRAAFGRLRPVGVLMPTGRITLGCHQWPRAGFPTDHALIAAVTRPGDSALPE